MKSRIVAAAFIATLCAGAPNATTLPLTPVPREGDRQPLAWQPQFALREVEVHGYVAQPLFSEVVVFGDSISDTGNVFLVTGGVAFPPPYFGGRILNGPMWVEALAEGLGLEAPAPFLLGGWNCAVAGAETGQGMSFFGTANVGSQVERFLAQRGGLPATN